MDLLDVIESGRFVGREFLVWLWFESEVLDGRFELPGPDGGSFDLWFESQLTLEAQRSEKEKSRLVGAAPSMTSEAHEALRRGKLPTKARIRIERGEQPYGFVLDAETLALSGVTLPTLMKDDDEERFYERMYLLEQLESMIDMLYSTFLTLRLDATWDDQVLPVIQDWIQDPEQVPVAKYRKIRSSVKPVAATKRATWLPD